MSSNASPIQLTHAATPLPSAPTVTGHNQLGARGSIESRGPVTSADSNPKGDGSSRQNSDGGDDAAILLSLAIGESRASSEDLTSIRDQRLQQRQEPERQQCQQAQQIERAHDATRKSEKDAKFEVHDCEAQSSNSTALADSPKEYNHRSPCSPSAQNNNNNSTTNNNDFDRSSKSNKEEKNFSPTATSNGDKLGSENNLSPLAKGLNSTNRIEHQCDSNASIKETNSQPQSGEEQEEVQHRRLEGDSKPLFDEIMMQQHQSSPTAICGLKPPLPGLNSNSSQVNSTRLSSGASMKKPFRSLSETNPPEQEDTRNRPVPKRKVSVFSHDGFPSVQLLDQSSFKSRSSSTASNVTSQDRTNDSATSSSSTAFTINACAPTNQTTSAKTSTAIVVSNNHEANNNSNLKSRRSVRSDTLGSTGSSRASSCDEPAIVALNSSNFSPSVSSISDSSKKKQHSLCSSTNMSISSSSLESITLPRNPKESSARVDSGKEESGEDAVEVGDSSMIEVDDDEDDDDTSDSLVTSERRPSVSVRMNGGDFKLSNQTVVPPFESIKEKLKKNTTPNAQMIQNHIDSLISQNEAIVDNWNLVSIRSYNSSRDIAPTTTAPPTTTASASTISTTGVKRASFCYVSPNNSNGSAYKSLASNSGAVSSETSPARPTKRWSTTALGTPNQPSIPMNIAPNGDPLSALRSFHDSRKLPEQVNYFAPRKLSHPSPRQQENPLHLENAIQNLSLKKNSDVHLLPELQFHSSTNAPTNQSLNPSPGLFPVDQQLQDRLRNHSLQDNHVAYSHLLLDSHEREVNEREIAMTAMLLGRQRQVFAGYQGAGAAIGSTKFGGELACLQNKQQQQQQQMIEQQIEQMRLNQLAMASFNQQLHQPHNIGMLSPIMAPMQQLQLQHQLNPDNLKAGGWTFGDYIRGQQQCSAESQLLNGILSKTNGYESHHQTLLPTHRHSIAGQPPHLMEHSGEMFTQSLDSTKPSHRCETCEISFWTKDLLDYHRLTQCAATRLSSSSVGSRASHHVSSAYSVQQAPSLEFNFMGSDNFEYPAGNQFHPLSKSASPPRPTNLSLTALEPSLESKLSCLDHSRQLVADGMTNPARERLHFITKSDSDPTPATSQQSVKHHESLPLKKRKISEPNMRYKQQ